MKYGFEGVELRFNTSWETPPVSSDDHTRWSALSPSGVMKVAFNQTSSLKIVAWWLPLVILTHARRGSGMNDSCGDSSFAMKVAEAGLPGAMPMNEWSEGFEAPPRHSPRVFIKLFEVLGEHDARRIP